MPTLEEHSRQAKVLIGMQIKGTPMLPSMEKKEVDVSPAKLAHWVAVTTHLSERLHMSVAVDNTPSSEGDDEEEPSTTNNDAGVTPSPPKRNVNFIEKTIYSQKQEFTI